MEVILLQKVANLGNIGDKVKVKPGFGRNFLLPQGKAALATAANIAKFEERRADLEKRAADDLSAARSRAAQLEGHALTITAKAGSEGKLFGSIGTADIAEALSADWHRDRAQRSAPAGRSDPSHRRAPRQGASAQRCRGRSDGDGRRRGVGPSGRRRWSRTPGRPLFAGVSAAHRTADALRVPPHSAEAEQAVLGGLLLDNSSWDSIADRLQRRGLLPPRPPAHLRRDRRALGAQRAERCGDAGRVPVRQRSRGGDGRPRLPGRPGARHADGGERPGLRRHRPRALGAAPVDPRQRRDRRHRLRQRRAHGHRAGRRGGAPGLRDRRAGAAHRLRLRAAARRARCDDRPARSAAPDAGSVDRRQYGLQRPRPHDRRPAARRPRDHRGPPLDGQDHARAQHRRVRGDLAQRARGRLQHGNVARAARVPDDLLARSRRSESSAHRDVRRRGLGAHQQRDRADAQCADLHRRQSAR